MNIFCLFRKPIKQNSSFSLCALTSQQRPWYQILLHAMYSGEPESSHFTTSTECHFNVLGEWLYSLKTGAKNEREKKVHIEIGVVRYFSQSVIDWGILVLQVSCVIDFPKADACELYNHWINCYFPSIEKLEGFLIWCIQVLIQLCVCMCVGKSVCAID